MIDDRHSRRPFWYLRRPPHTVASEIDEELRTHLEMRIEELTAAGMPVDAARQEALRLFGDLDAAREYCRLEDERKDTHMQRTLKIRDFIEDVKISLRSLWRVPVLALTIVATVGLGIGATAAIFGAVNAALLRPLPYAEPERLMRIYTDAPPFVFRFSVADYLALDEQQTQFERIAGYTDRSMTFSNGEVAELLRGRMVTWTYFATLGIRPETGRDFTEQDGRPGSPPAVMVTHGFWQRWMGGRKDAMGQIVKLDGADYVVAGVLPAVTGPLEQQQDFFVAAQLTPPPRKGPFLYTVIARLRHGVDSASATSELREINRRIFPIWRASYQDDKATWSLMDLKTQVVGNVGTIAGISLAAVALVWLIACANASNLLIARVASRRRELTVRAAIGASRGRIVRFLLAESALLAAGSVAAGLALAWVGMELLRNVGATYFPRMQEIRFDGPMAALLAGLTLTSGLIFGLIPAMYGSGKPIDESLQSLGRSTTGSPAVRRIRRLLVGSQFAIATPLLVVAGLLLVSLNELRQVDIGVDGRNVITGSIRLPAAQYRDPAGAVSFWDELKRRVESLPGIAGVAFADGRPPAFVGNLNNFDLEESPTPPGESQPVTPWIAVTPEYFGVLGIRLLEGRLLNERDAQPPDPNAFVGASVLVDRAWARRFFPNRSALGKRFKQGGCSTCPWTTVVGVVSDVKYGGVDQPDQGAVYTALSGSLVRILLVRTTGDPLGALPAVRQVVRDLNPAAPLSSVATIDELTMRSIQRPRSLSLLIAAFAAVALILSVVGIYGVMAYYVQQHAKDISIRMALGGSSTDVMRLVVGQGMKVVIGGVVAGVLTALAVTRLVSSLLFGVGAVDATTFAFVCALLLAVALAACLIPARRAVRVQPAMVLRNEQS